MACDIGCVCSNYRANTVGLEWTEGPSDSGAVIGAAEPDGSIPIRKTRVVQILLFFFFFQRSVLFMNMKSFCANNNKKNNNNNNLTFCNDFYIDVSWSSITITIAHIYGIFIYTINAACYRYLDFNILLFLQHQEITSVHSNGTFCCNIKWKCISFPLEKRASHMSLKTVHLNNEPTDEQHKKHHTNTYQLVS